MSNFSARLLIIVFLLVNSQTISQEPPNFFTLIGNIKSLQANFEQNSYQDNRLIKTQKGQLNFQAPDQLKWHQKKPSEQIIVINQGITWIYDIELEQATKRKSNLTNTPLSWLFQLNLKQNPIFLKQDKQILWYQLITDNKLTFKFGFNQQHQLVDIMFNNLLNHKTTIHLSQHQTPLLQNFSLNLPLSVDIIDYSK